VRQRLFDTWFLWGRYGVLYYRDLRPERYAWYHLAKLGVEARF
jgi:hypothetical protein